MRIGKAPPTELVEKTLRVEVGRRQGAGEHRRVLFLFSNRRFVSLYSLGYADSLVRLRQFEDDPTNGEYCRAGNVAHLRW
jgi:hypothetical protein